jgi:hypothetical protein
VPSYSVYRTIGAKPILPWALAVHIPRSSAAGHEVGKLAARKRKVVFIKFCKTGSWARYLEPVTERVLGEAHASSGAVVGCALVPTAVDVRHYETGARGTNPRIGSAEPSEEAT